MKNKVELTDLEIESFVTRLPMEKAHTVKGGSFATGGGPQCPPNPTRGPAVCTGT